MNSSFVLVFEPINGTIEQSDIFTVNIRWHSPEYIPSENNNTYKSYITFNTA